MLAYTDRNTVKLDFDHTPFKTVKYWASRACNWFELEGFLILKSSEKCYHVIFNRTVPWSENIHVVAWVCLESDIYSLTRWFIMQSIKESSTLRVTPKGDKPSPRIVYRYGKEDIEIRNFLEYRKLIKSIYKYLAC
jgi:hypothetical protein